MNEVGWKSAERAVKISSCIFSLVKIEIWKVYPRVDPDKT
jgi:hypothetical protein